MTTSLKPYKGIFGLPPTGHTDSEMISNTMPVLEITPGEPNFKLGLTLFSINTIDGWKNYIDILENHGFSVDDVGKPLKYAFIADNFPTDTFSNEYTETFLQKFTDVASSGLSQLVQMSGKANALDAAGSYGEILQKTGAAMGEGGMAGVVKGLGGATVSGVNALKRLEASLKGGDSALSRTLGGGMNLVSKMMAGHRIDFPQIWSNSGYSPSYSVTIRLYNPNPGSKQSTLQYIAGPLATILCLAVPRTLNGASYRWPFYHKIRVRGLYNLDPAVITNITVVKGGDQQQIGYSQMMGMCDIRIDFISLHRSMLLDEKEPTVDNRPTVRNYIEELTNGRPVFTRSTMNNINNVKTGANASIQLGKPLTARELQKEQRERAAAVRIPQRQTVTSANRVPPDEKLKGTALEAETPDGALAEREVESDTGLFGPIAPG